MESTWLLLEEYIEYKVISTDNIRNLADYVHAKYI